MYDTHLERISQRPGERIQVLLHRKLLEKFLSKVDNDFPISEILEIGPGGGRLAREIISRGINYAAVEPTKSMITATQESICKNELSGYQLEIYGDKLPNLDSKLLNRFDAVLLVHVLEHAYNPYDAHDWLSALKTTLKPGGYVFLMSPDYIDYQGEFFECDWSHSFPTTLNNVREIMKDVGF